MQVLLSTECMFDQLLSGVYHCENVLDWDDVQIFFRWILEGLYLDHGGGEASISLELAQSFLTNMLATTFPRLGMLQSQQ